MEKKFVIIIMVFGLFVMLFSDMSFISRSMANMNSSFFGEEFEKTTWTLSFYFFNVFFSALKISIILLISLSAVPYGISKIFRIFFPTTPRDMVYLFSNAIPSIFLVSILLVKSINKVFCSTLSLPQEGMAYALAAGLMIFILYKLLFNAYAK